MDYKPLFINFGKMLIAGTLTFGICYVSANLFNEIQLPKYVFETVVSSYEVEEYKNAVKQVDKSCFITFTAINGIDGFFNKNIIT